MKIGILTWFFGANYGARAHTYALQQVLLELGYECEFINYVPPHSMKINVLTNLNCENIKKHPFRACQCIIRCLRFWNSKRINKKGQKVTTAGNIDHAGYDLVILGSDAVFNTKHPLFNDLYYGVGIQNTPKISYAPSCEYIDQNTALSQEIKNSLSEMKSIAVRDNYTAELVRKNTGIDAKVVLDPAFLYDFSTLEKFLPERDYILVYSFSDWTQYASQIRVYAKTHGLKIISVGRFCAWADRSYDAASIYQWFGAFRNARLVFTDSFHGTVFSIKYGIEFIMVSREDKRHKIGDLLKQLEIDRTFYQGENIDEYLSAPLNYARINERIEILKSASIDYLKNAVFTVDHKKT